MTGLKDRKAGFLSVIVSLVATGCAGNALVGSEPLVSDDETLIESVSRVDLVYELDPEGRGCAEYTRRIPESSCTLDQAIRGFYLYTYAPDDEAAPDVLQISNVAAVYAEKQARLLNQLVSEIRLLSPGFDSSTYFGALRFQDQPTTPDAAGEPGDEVLQIFLQDRASDIVSRVRMAQALTPNLEFQRQRRNRVQGRIIAASDAACDRYKRSLNALFSDANFRFGTAATTAGGLGAIFKGEDTARALAGIAGIISGVRAEYNDAYFRNKVVEVLTKAMDIVRKKRLDEIRRRESLLLLDYTVEDAIADAIQYNASCTLIAGLQETQESLQTVSDPGLKWLARTFGGAESNEAATNQLFENLGRVIGQVQELEKASEDAITSVPAPTESEDGEDPEPPVTGDRAGPNGEN